MFTFMLTLLGFGLASAQEKVARTYFEAAPMHFGSYDEFIPAKLAAKWVGKEYIPFRRHKIRLQSPQSDWEEGLALGNGELGAIVFGKPNTLRFGIGHLQAWDNRELPWTDESGFWGHSWQHFVDVVRRKDVKEYDRLANTLPRWNPRPSPQSCGTLEISFEDDELPKRDERVLTLHDALASLEYEGAAGQYQASVFVAAQEPVMAIDWIGTLPVGKQLTISLYRHTSGAHRHTGGALRLGREGNLLWVDYDLPLGLRYVMMAAVEGDGFSTSVQENGRVCAVRQSGGQTKLRLLLTVVTSDQAADPLAEAKRILLKAQKKDPVQRLREHKSWWEQFWRKSDISLPDQLLERQWYFALYLLSSCSRQGRLLPSARGLWAYELDPWLSRYYPHICVQMEYWPIYGSNHLELGKPFYAFFLDALPEADRRTRRHYGWGGLYVPFNTGPRLQEDKGSFQYLWHGGGVWVAQHYWLHYLYSKDVEFLRHTAYPVMKACAEFYEGLFEREPSGRIRLFPSNMPEQTGAPFRRFGPEGAKHFKFWGVNSLVDLVFLKVLYRGLVEAGQLLDVETQEQARWANTLKNLPPYPQVDGHLIDFEGVEFKNPHPMMPSLLAPLYPACEIGLDSSPDMQALGRASIENILERQPYTDWYVHDWPWMAAIVTQLGLGEDAYLYLSGYLSRYAYPNNGLIYIHPLGHAPPNQEKLFVIEIAIGLAAPVNEMLLQGHQGIIHVFPAVPKGWTVRFNSLRCEGPFLVSSEMKDGQVEYVLVRALSGGTCRLHNPFHGPEVTVYQIRQEGKRSIVASTHVQQTICFPVVSGQTYLIEAASCTK